MSWATYTVLPNFIHILLSCMQLRSQEVVPESNLLMSGAWGLTESKPLLPTSALLPGSAPANACFRPPNNQTQCYGPRHLKSLRPPLSPKPLSPTRPYQTPVSVPKPLKSAVSVILWVELSAVSMTEGVWNVSLVVAVTSRTERLWRRPPKHRLPRTCGGGKGCFLHVKKGGLWEELCTHTLHVQNIWGHLEIHWLYSGRGYSAIVWANLKPKVRASARPWRCTCYQCAHKFVANVWHVVSRDSCPWFVRVFFRRGGF